MLIIENQKQLIDEKNQIKVDEKNEKEEKNLIDDDSV